MTVKRTFYLIVAVTMLFGGGCEKSDQTGSISGVITDKVSVEPIRGASVELYAGETLKAKAVTGSEGQYEFNKLSSGSYKLAVTINGYKDLSYNVNVSAGTTARADMQAEKLPSSLRVVDDGKQDMSELDFGSAASDNIHSFNIFNDNGPVSVQWKITVNANWIISVEPLSGNLMSGGTQAVIVTIDRSKLADGENKTTIQITSNNYGSKELPVKATGFTSSTNSLPVLTTSQATNITTNSATLGGNISNVGVPAYIEKGVCYSTSQNPTISNTKITATGSSTGSYTASATGLSANTTYYVRAYATNTAGTAYGSQVNFITNANNSLPVLTTSQATNITTTSATLGGNISNAGVPAYTEKGVCYSTSQNPTISNTKITATGSSTGSYTASATGLSANTTYYVRAYATNAAGTAYGSQVSFTTSGANSLPVLTTLQVTYVTANSATLGGNISNVGVPAYTEKGICYSTSQNPTINNTRIKVSTSNTTGDYTASATDLSANTTYYARAYATNTVGTAYGGQVSFKTANTSSQNAQVRFTKEKGYLYATEMAIVDIDITDVFADYEFGTDSGTSPYYDIPAGSYYPVYYYAFPGSEGWNFCLDSPYTYYFQGGLKYTVVCSDDGTYLSFYVTYDGLRSSQVVQSNPIRTIEMPKITQATKVKAKADVK